MVQVALLLLLAGPVIPPKGDAYLPLFVIERSTNANVVHYDAWVTRSGALNPREPVIAYWIMLAANGRREDLNGLEKKTGYGFKVVKDTSAALFHMALVSQKGREIRVFLKDGVPRAETRIGTCSAYLQKIYISTGKVNVLHVNYMELFGTDTSTSVSCYERITP